MNNSNIPATLLRWWQRYWALSRGMKLGLAIATIFGLVTIVGAFSDSGSDDTLAASGESATETPTTADPATTATPVPTATLTSTPNPTVTAVPATSTATAAPTIPPATATPTIPTATATAASTPAALEGTAVLGGARTAWEAQHGKPERELFGERFEAETPLAWIVVAFRDDGNGIARAWYVDFQTESGKALPIDDARDRAKALVPDDAVEVSTYLSRFDAVVEVFHSQKLAAAWAGLSHEASEQLWGGEEPGTFIRIAANRDETTSGWVTIALGNNP